MSTKLGSQGRKPEVLTSCDILTNTWSPWPCFFFFSKIKVKHRRPVQSEATSSKSNTWYVEGKEATTDRSCLQRNEEEKQCKENKTKNNNKKQNLLGWRRDSLWSGGGGQTIDSSRWLWRKEQPTWNDDNLKIIIKSWWGDGDRGRGWGVGEETWQERFGSLESYMSSNDMMSDDTT